MKNIYFFCWFESYLKYRCDEDVYMMLWYVWGCIGLLDVGKFVSLFMKIKCCYGLEYFYI